jgi:hypothetical protein
VQAVAAHVDQFAGRRISTFVDPGQNELENYAREEQYENQPPHPGDNTLSPPPEPTTRDVHLRLLFSGVVPAGESGAV